MIDINNQLHAIHREVCQRDTENGEVVGALLRRRYDASVETVWQAIVDPDRVRRWFLPLTGDLHLNGTFQFEGNAGGEILHCEEATHLQVTFGDQTSLVSLRFTVDGDGTVLEFEHTVPMAMAGSGAGALYVGPGWDGALMALALYLDGIIAENPAEAAHSPEAQEFSKRSIQEWVTVIETSGTATTDEIAAASGVALAQFSPDLAQA